MSQLSGLMLFSGRFIRPHKTNRGQTSSTHLNSKATHAATRLYVLERTSIDTYPDLEFHALVVPKYGLHLKVNAHRGDEGGCEAIVGVAEEEAGLAHAGVANDEQLEHVVKVLVGGILLPLGVSATRHFIRLERCCTEGMETRIRKH